MHSAVVKTDSGGSEIHGSAVETGREGSKRNCSGVETESAGSEINGSAVKIDGGVSKIHDSWVDTDRIGSEIHGSAVETGREGSKRNCSGVETESAGSEINGSAVKIDGGVSKIHDSWVDTDRGGSEINGSGAEKERLDGNIESSSATRKYKDRYSFLCSTRWRIVGYLFLSFMFLFMHRVNLSLAVVCMVDTTDRPYVSTVANVTETVDVVDIHNWTTESEGYILRNVSLGQRSEIVQSSCVTGASEDETKEGRLVELHWKKSDVSVLLSSYFYGSFFTQIPAGTMADIFGGKHIVTASMLLSVACSILTPVCARTSLILMFAVRILLGLAGGAVIPAGMSILNSWATPNERPVMIAFLGAGLLTGAIITFLTSGLLCAYGFDNIFYIHGIVTGLFVVLWLVEAHSRPEDHPRIPTEELHFIETSRRHAKPTKATRTPWLRLLLSKPQWATTIAHFCFNWSFFTVLINVPLFLKEVLKFDIKSNGLYSSIPYVFQIVSAISCSKLSVIVIKTRCLSPLATRRTFNTVSLVGIGVCLVCAGYISCEKRYVAVILLCLSCTSAGFVYGGFLANHAEYAGQFAGTAFGITNAGGVISSIVASMMAGLLTPNVT